MHALPYISAWVKDDANMEGFLLGTHNIGGRPPTMLPMIITHVDGGAAVRRSDMVVNGVVDITKMLILYNAFFQILVVFGLGNSIAALLLAHHAMFSRVVQKG